MIMHHDYDCLVMIDVIQKKCEATIEMERIMKAVVFLTASIAKVT